MCKKLICLVFFVLVLSLFQTSIANAVDPSLALVGWWRLDEGSGTTALDATGNGNNGTLEDGPTVVDGQFGQALAFEDSRVAIPASDSLTANLFQRSFTLSAWINPTRTGNTWQQIFRSMIAADTSNDTLFITNDGKLSWRGRVGGGWAGGMCETAPDVVPADQWTHVAVTGDGMNFRIYVNGILSQESAFQTTDGTNAMYYIGGDPTWIGESYTGMVGDVRIYNKALSVSEVSNLASDPVSPIGVIELTDALDTTLSFTTGGDEDWFSQTLRWYHDGDAVQSGEITDEQESWMQTTVNGSGTVSFFWKVSSEGNYDCLEFYIDGKLKDQISGSEDWHDMTYEITGSGSHTLEWLYSKDGSMSMGDDCGWVDKVEWTPAP